jgi:hypothetical protein
MRVKRWGTAKDVILKGLCHGFLEVRIIKELRDGKRKRILGVKRRLLKGSVRASWR